MPEQETQAREQSTRSLSIAILTPEVVGCYSPPRIGEYYFSLARNLVRWGHKVTLVHMVACPVSEYEQRFPGVRQRHESAGITFVGAPDVAVVTLGCGPRLPWVADLWLNENAFDVIHVPDVGGLGYYALTARSVGRRYLQSRFVVTAFGGTAQQQDAMEAVARDVEIVTAGFCEMASVEMADEVILTSEFARDGLARMGCRLPSTAVVEPVLLGVEPLLTGPLRMAPRWDRQITLVASRPLEGFVQIVQRTLKVCADLLAKNERTPSVSVRILSVDGGLSANELQSAFGSVSSPWPVHFDCTSWEEAALVLPREDGIAVFLSAGQLADALTGSLIAASVPVLVASRTDTAELLASESRSVFTARPLDPTGIAEQLLPLLKAPVLPASSPAMTREALLERWRERHAQPVLPAPAPAEISSKPLVSACITHFQRPQLLAQALHSVAWQTYGNLEIVIVDDGSKDEASKAFLAELESTWNGPPLSVVRQPNAYLGAARNTAWRAAQGEYVVFLDDDNAWKSEMVAAMVEASVRCNADIVTCLCDHVAGDGPLWEGAAGRFAGIYLTMGADLTRGVVDNVFGDANALVRRRTLMALDGFTEDYGLGFEDWEFFSRALLAGHRLVCIPDSLFWYRLTEASMLRGATQQSLFPNYMRALRPHLDAAPAHLRPLLRYALGCRLTAGWFNQAMAMAQQERQRADLLQAQLSSLTKEMEALRRIKQAGSQETWASQSLNGVTTDLAPQASPAPAAIPAAQALPRRLHLGCGTHILDGWLNTDLEPQAPGVLHLDASKRFPFADDQFEFIFSEHMIEHLDFRAGVSMLRECLRVLKPGGRIRVATPSLDFLLGLYFDSNKDLHSQYIRWANAIFAPDGIDNDPLYVINNFVRNWGHQFIYNQRLLTKSLMRTGFVDIEFFNINESRHAELADLEFEARLPPGFLQLETMTAEASKPMR